jgi:pimeloyl-ACP methyl ester carboxylesterase
LPLTIAGTSLDVAGMYRDGIGIPLVFLHGFGSTKEDYADVIQQTPLADRPILAYDAPGCGATACSDISVVSIPFLVSVAAAVLRAKGIERFHLIGHSMGGLTALMLADQGPMQVASLVDIEGNLAPEKTASSAARSSATRTTTLTPSWRSSPSVPGTPATTPAPCTPRRCRTGPEPALSARSSNPWSNCPTTGISSTGSSRCRCRGC